MIVNGNGQNLFGFVLTDDVFVELRLDFRGSQKLHFVGSLGFSVVFFHYFAANFYTFVADINTVRSGDKSFYEFFGFAAKRAEQLIFVIFHISP